MLMGVIWEAIMRAHPRFSTTGGGVPMLRGRMSLGFSGATEETSTSSRFERWNRPRSLKKSGLFDVGHFGSTQVMILACRKFLSKMRHPYRWSVRASTLSHSVGSELTG